MFQYPGASKVLLHIRESENFWALVVATAGERGYGAPCGELVHQFLVSFSFLPSYIVPPDIFIFFGHLGTA